MFKLYFWRIEYKSSVAPLARRLFVAVMFNLVSACPFVMSSVYAQAFSPVGTQVTYDAGLRCSVPRWQVADLNLDGSPDFVLGATPTSAYSGVSSSGEIMLWIAQTDGSFQERTRQLFGGNVTAAYLYSNVRIADLNGDGVPDILVPDAGLDTYVNGIPTGPWLGATPKLALSSGGGYFDASSQLGSLPASFAHSADIADINRNGTKDIYIGSITSGESRLMPYLLINDGNGRFTYDQSRLPSLVVQSGFAPTTPIDATTRIGSSQQYTNSLFADVNRDGSVDLVLFPIATVPNGLVLINDGTGNFNRYAPINLPPGLYGGSNMSVRTNPDGSLTFGQAPGVGTVGLDAKAVDLNSDGYPDIVVLQTQVDENNIVYYRGGKIQILINQQGRGFVDESVARGAPGYDATQNYDSYHGELATFDINGDGHPDLIAMRVTPTGYFPDVFLNDGDGRFVRATIEGLPAQGFIVPLSGGNNQNVRVASVQVVYRGGGTDPLACNMVVQAYEKTVPSQTTTSTAIEFYKADIDHYFMTASTDEATALDNKPEWNWVRTGKTFNIWMSQSVAPVNASPVCRFFGVFSNGTVGSHFYTVDAAECDMLKSRLDWGWGYENNAFYAVKLVGGICPGGTSPVYRAYNNGMGGAPNHRYVATQAEVAAMVAQGWVSEGTAFCGAQ